MRTFTLAFRRRHLWSLGIERIAAVGCSTGGWLALMAGMRHAVTCVAAVAPGNMVDGDP